MSRIKDTIISISDNATTSALTTLLSRVPSTDFTPYSKWSGVSRKGAQLYCLSFSVMDPNKLNLDPDFRPNLVQDPGLCYQVFRRKNNLEKNMYLHVCSVADPHGSGSSKKCKSR